MAAVAHEKNLYDAHTLPEVLDQAEAITDIRATPLGREFVDGTEVQRTIASKKRGDAKTLSSPGRASPPVISHLKADFRLSRCFLKDFRGDQLNLMLAAAAWNFRKWMRLFTLFWLRLLCSLPTQNF